MSPLAARRARERRRRRWQRIGLASVVAAVFALLVWAIGFSSLLSVRHVEVEGAAGARAAEVRRVADVPVGLPLIRVDVDAVRDRLLERPELAAEVTVRRAWPSTIAIRVRPRAPALVLRDGSTLRIADTGGVIYTTVAKAPPGLPVVTASGPNGATKEAVRAALSLITALPPDLEAKVGSITVSGADLVRFRIGRVEVVWGGDAEPERKVQLIRELLRTAPKRIDVSAPDTPATS